jgi:hypothetical protein
MLGVKVSGSKGAYIWDLQGTTLKNLFSGTSASTITKAIAGNFMQQYITGSATTGTYRNIYSKLFLTGGAGGEAGRFYTEVSAAAPVDTCNGVHATLGFGASAGNITGLGTAGRFTVMIPNRALTGTVAGLQSELYCEDTGSTSSGNINFFRCVIDGNATGIDLVGVVANLFNISGPAAMIGDTAMVRTNTNAATHGIRCIINGVRYDILASTAHS